MTEILLGALVALIVPQLNRLPPVAFFALLSLATAIFIHAPILVAIAWIWLLEDYTRERAL